MRDINSETEPLNSPPTYEESDPSPSYAEPPSTEPRQSLYLFILYGLSFILSIVGLVYTFRGWIIARTAPLDKWGKKSEIDSYERNFYGMMSIYTLFSFNILWTGMNLYFLRAGKGKYDDLSYMNSVYDFLVWAMFIAFGVLNMVIALWDRRLCDGWGSESSHMYKECDIAQYNLLVVEIVAVSLGLIVAVMHFILLIARCCSPGRRGEEERSGWLRMRIREEEDVLRILLERRRLLEEDAQQERGIPSMSGEEVHLQQSERDLIEVGQEPRPHGSV